MQNRSTPKIYADTELLGCRIDPPQKIYADTELLGCRVKMDGAIGMSNKIYADTELLGCRVKMDGGRGMVDSITAGDRGEILFHVQFSDGRRLSMPRSQLESILSDIDLTVSAELSLKTSATKAMEQKFVPHVVNAFHSSAVYFLENMLKKTADGSEFVTYKELVRAYEIFSRMSLGGASMWFRSYVQKKFRVTYMKIHEQNREMVLFGGVGKGLRLVC
jgi:hypothetical protein